ncbi:unnamed protein product [Agarophyton chilense]|eukprot:gb/GEZJ01004057.1/.p1 GENE.gb/GEZJ01004057.1/~~gb/GEZJ01004057.1/.p1  ORF type:complete len:609 (-),score=72.46 gb/GEZJ01004057.1/:191-2017(-)
MTHFLQQPFHQGELLAQQLAGTQGVAAELGHGMSRSLPPTAVFNYMLQNLNIIWLSTVTPCSNPLDASLWVSPVFGHAPDLAHASSTRLLQFHLQPLSDTDVLRRNLSPLLTKNTALPAGVLIIDLDARRRYRTNGLLSLSSCPAESTEAAPHSLTLDMSVEEAFPNCPKYIQRRLLDPSTSEMPPVPHAIQYESDTKLSPADTSLITAADTLFFGTYNPSTGLDANHRGGRPGFIRVTSDDSLYWPDYRGNGMFQSFGNLQQNDKAGVTIFDFETGHLLQLSGSARVQWEKSAYPDVEAAAERIVTFKVDHVRRSIGPVTNFRWNLSDYSPYNPIIPKQDASTELADDNSIHVSLVKIVSEAPSVKTFRFLAPKYIPFLPGQYCTFEFDQLPGIDEKLLPVVRTWTLSEAANSTKGDLTLEVSVKRKPGGLMSNWLHDNAKLGMRAKLLGIGGEMTPFLDNNLPKKLLFISGGIGMTPNMAILRGIGARSKGNVGSQPDIVFLHQEREYSEIPFQSELLRRARLSKGRTRLFFVISGENQISLAGEPEDATLVSGRIGAALLREQVLDLADRTVFMCGPIGFMDKLRATLLDLGASPTRIITEQFTF